MLSSRGSLAALIVVASLALSACGFEPLHRGSSASSAAALANVEIARIEDRAGQMLRNDLLSMMAPRGYVASPEYRLEITLSESKREVLLEDTSFSTRADVIVTAQTKLIRQVDGEIVESGRVEAVSGYNILSASQEYANVVSERNAREGALKLVARDIVRQVSVWLRNADSGA